MRYAQGLHAWSICDRCGFRYPYHAIRVEADTHLHVCPDCEDEPEPKRAVGPDAIVLRSPRPDSLEGTEATDEYEGLMPEP